MSASSKKKLRNEQGAAKMTERQLAEQKEAKKLKAYTTAFVVVLAALLIIALVIGISQTITTSGMREKNTVAMTVGEHEISNAELNYYYIDTVNNFYSQNGSYASIFGLYVTLPLYEQYDLGDESGETWADYFLSSAKSSVQSIYALVDEANAVGHTMTEAEAANIETAVSTASLYATLYGYGDVETYLKAMYGNGATEESYRDYVEKSLLADSYYAAYANSLTYEDTDLRAKEAENYNLYSAFDYNYYHLPASKFLEGGTTDENGNTTYSDAEKEASVALAKEAAEALAAQEFATVADFDAAIAAMEINAEVEDAASTSYDDLAYGSIHSVIAEWLSDPSRKAGDVDCLENATTTTAEDGTETKTVNGYYVVYFRGVNDNTFALKDARHILVAFEGGTTDDSGVTTYSDEEKAAAKTAAEELLAQWEAGEATEESFATLANEQSDDGDGTTGGLYVNIYPNEMVAAFEDWCYDESRSTGDTGIIETEYGYHVMYFVGDSDLTYRDYQIQQELMNEDVSEWYTALVEAAAVTDGDTSYISKDLVLSSN